MIWDFLRGKGDLFTDKRRINLNVINSFTLKCPRRESFSYVLSII